MVNTENPRAVLDRAVLTDPADGRKYAVSIEMIDPETAEEYLTLSMGNRTEKKETIDGKYAADLLAGRWFLNGETLVFDEAGIFRDGHNRLKTVVKTGVPMKTFVIRGIRPEGVVSIDTGVSRSLIDHLRLSGRMAYAPWIAAIAKSYTLWEASGRIAPSRPQTISHAAIDTVLGKPEREQEIANAAAFLSGIFRAQRDEPRIKVMAGLYGLVYLLGARVNGDVTRMFFMRLASSAGDDWTHASGDPELAFRSRMMRAYQNRERVPEAHVAYMLARAWNERQEGFKLHRCQAPTGEQQAEPLVPATATAYLAELKPSRSSRH